MSRPKSPFLTEEYVELLRQKHRDKPWGGQGHSWVKWVAPLIELLEIERPTVLDYGCGRGTFKPALLEVMPEADVREYDPGVEGKDEFPEPADFVLCTDVLEHVEPEFVIPTLKYIAELTKRQCFMVIACELSKSLLPDGRNAHLTIEPADWWINNVRKCFGKEFEFRVFERKRGRTIICATRK